MTQALIGLGEAIELPGARLGLLSDSHGDVRMTQAAIASLLSRNVSAVVHLGDLCSDAVLEELVGLNLESGAPVAALAVPGNMDDNPSALVRHGARLGVNVAHPALHLMYGGTRLVAHHGHIDRIERAAIDSNVEYVLHGHTHRVRDEKCGGTRFINPGALHRAATYTAAMLDLATGDLEVFEVSRSAP